MPFKVFSFYVCERNSSGLQRKIYWFTFEFIASKIRIGIFTRKKNIPFNIWLFLQSLMYTVNIWTIFAMIDNMTVWLTVRDTQTAFGHVAQNLLNVQFHFISDVWTLSVRQPTNERTEKNCLNSLQFIYRCELYFRIHKMYNVQCTIAIKTWPSRFTC